MEKATQTARTLLMVAVMIAAAIVPMAPEAVELRDEARAMGASISTDVTSLTLDEGGSNWYEVSLDEAPDGTLVITPSSDNSAVTLDPSYIKFTKVNWDMPQYIWVDIADTDDDGADTTATISHSISGSDTVFASATIGDVSVTGTDYDVDTDGDGLHDGLDTDDDGDGVNDADEEAGCELVIDCDGDGVDDDQDAFDIDPNESADADGDGIGDNADEFDGDATEDTDSDGDGVGDNSDAFPDDANESADADGDGVGDNSDAFPDDANESADADGDGVGDNGDAFPDDATEDTDTDGDGVGDNGDAFPDDATEDTDTDGDGVGDNGDAFPDDATEDTDTDEDGTGNNADTDDDGDGVDDSAEDSGCDLLADCDGDGVNDDTDAFDTDANATTDTDGDGLADEISVTGAVFDFDFEDGALPTAVTWELSQCTGSDSSCVAGTSAGDWTVSDDTPIDGTYSLKSGDLSTNYENTNISVTFTSAEGTMSFDYQISSLCRDYASTYYDGFRLYVDGVLVDNPSDGGTACANGVWGGTQETWDTTHPAYSTSYFVCADGSDGFSISYVPSWLGDGWDDCSDGSDEDSTYYDGLLSEGPVSGTHEQDLSAGTHTVLFQFHGGTSSAAGLSIAWIDNLVIPVAAGTAGSVGPTTTTDGTSLDNDDDGDGYLDADETTNCESSSDPLDATDMPLYDNDGDYSCDAVDEDDDNDGVLDVDEADGSALDLDADGSADGINCANETDCDGDGVDDATDTHPADPTETTDMDGDGIGDNSDADRDGDGYLNTNDEFPDDESEWADNDGDGTGDNADTDDDTCPAADGADTDSDGTADATCGTFTGLGSSLGYDFYPGDGVADEDDAFPLSPAETGDNDGDGWGDNADADDDNDGISDQQDDDIDGDGFSNDDEDTNCVGGLSDPQDGTDTPADMDGDGICDALDDDTDGDGTVDATDAFPEDACADTDTDGDGMPDTLAANCTTSLTEDDDDDFDASNVEVTYVLSIADSWNDGTYEAYIYSQSDDDGDGELDLLLTCARTDSPCTVTAGDVHVYVDTDNYYSEVTVSVAVDGNTVLTAQPSTSALTLLGSLTATDYSAGIWTDSDEATCGTDPIDSTDTPTDTDGDNLCDDAQDDDNDGDGSSNDDDAFPLDATETTDTDGDGTGDNADTDDDDDGVADDDDAFPLDDTEDTDTDGDLIGDNADTDDDGDGFSDEDESDCGTDSLDATDVPLDTDSDGVCDGEDDDDDGDGIEDSEESDGSGLTPAADCTIAVDCDGDGVDDSDEVNGSALDLDGDGTADGIDCAVSTDCDGDGSGDGEDAFPVDATETTDTDGDGIGNNADTDDDGDGYSDADETTNCGDGTTTTAYSSSSDPLNDSDTPDDMDGDGLCDYLDDDRDGDGLTNGWDSCPDDYGTLDTDGDGICDESDDDDDGDGVNDDDDAFPLDGSEDTDTDGDGVGDNSDADDDNDGTDDQADECPLDSSGTTDTDGDGACDESDADDDDDTVLDADEESGCELLSDCDGDGVGDETDAFDNDAEATTDTDGDGMPDSITGATLTSETYTLEAVDGDLSMHVVASEVNGGILCIIDTSNFGESCTFTTDVGITLYADDVSYNSYVTSVTYGIGSVMLTSSDGTELVNESITYDWYYDSYFGVYDLYSDSAVTTTDGLELDSDDDGDGYGDAAEDSDCSTGDSTDSSVTPDDNDGDGICDDLDDDDDNDGYSDSHESTCGTDSMTADDVSDFDGDGTCDGEDADDDNDGTDDDDDWAPYDGSEWLDTDNDGTGDNADDDADGDGTPDSDDVDPTDRCSNLDTDGDGLADSYDSCSSMGFYSTLDADAGDNAGEGFDDGDHVGITDDTTLFGGAAAGNQWFQVADTDGVFRMYFDHATGVSAVSMWIALASTDYEDEDYYASYWVGDDGTTTELGNSQNSWGDIDNCWCEGFWGQWAVEVPSEDGYLMLEASNDDDAEHWGLDNVAYHDNNWEVISMVTFEDSVEDMGVYTTPSSPALLAGTYTVQIDDSYGDGGHGITVTNGADTLCSIGQYDYSSTASCTFDLTAYSNEEISVAVDTDSWASEGTLTVTFYDGTTAVETWSGDTSFDYAHVGDELLEQAGEYTITISDPGWGDGGHGVEAYFNGESVCSIGQYEYSSSASCTFTGTGFPDSVLDIDIDTDSYPTEGQLDVTFPDGTTATETWTADTSFSYANHSGTDVQPVAGEVRLSNGHGATVSLDTSSYHTGTVDDDDDNDGYADADDAFPTDASEWDDMDGDGIGSNADNDDDGDGVNDGADDFPRHSHATTDTDGDGMPDDIGMTDGHVMDDFEAGNFSGLDGAWSRSGDANWGITSWSAAASGYGAKSGTIDHNESSTLEATLETSDGWYSFHWAIDSEERYDELTFSIDGVEVVSVSGRTSNWEFVCGTPGSYSDTSWEAMSLNDGSIPGNWVNDGYADCGDTDGDGISDDEQASSSWYQPIEGTFEGYVDAGTHTFTWTYSKDSSDSYEANQDKALVDDIMIPVIVQGDGECSDGTENCNIEDMDDDEDGVADEFDDCPTDAGEQIDTDGDGYCDNADADDDNDGTYDYNDAMPLDPNETSDYDGDGIGDNADPDDDNDGCDDEVDDLPYDDSDCVDTDGDGVGDDTDLDDDGDNVMDVDDPFPLDGSAWADNDGDGEPDVTGDPPFLGDFEGASIPAGWTTFGDADWFVCGMGTCGTTSGNAINGSYMAESGDISDAETSSIEISVDTLAGDVSFAYETSTETNWDYLRFYVDGSLAMSWSGVTSGTYTTTVSAGYHTFEWMYYKDFSVSSNADTVWIDDVSLPVSQVTNNSDPDDDNDGVYDEFDLDPFDPCVSLDTDGDGEPDWVMTGLFDMSGTGDEQFIVDCDASMWYEDWDDDGDGWGDEEEWLCGSNHLDADEAPYDMDQDWICDELDEDLDNDGAVNPVNNCELHLAYGDNASFVDCVADGFYAVDADGDGEASYMELMHAWTFQWPSDMDDEDDWDDEDDEDDWDDEDDGAEDMGGIGSRMGHENGTGDNGTGDHGDDNGTGDHGDDNGTGDHGDDNGTGDHGDDNGTGEEPEEPESWPSQEDFDAFDMMFWDWVSAWDADNSTSLSFDEFWQINADTWEGWDFENPGWSEDTTEWDQFPFDPSEQTDTDMDGMGDNSDSDDDNDGVPDGLDAFPYDPTESNDLDGDGIGDNSDNDVDGDGIDNDQDDFDSDPNAASDNDQDGVDDASDSDDDNDGVPDVADWAPLDASEQYDTDGDGVGDNADTDDDNDGTEDAEDAFPLDASENADADGDGVGDNSDPDDDNDGTPDGLDDFPYDATEQRDSDGDGIGDVADPDTDEDGYLNSDDAFPMNSNEWLDTDGDNIGDNSDTDIDGDSVLNDDDWAPLDSAEWMDTDGDGTGDNADTDDDGDTYSDEDEYSCGTDSKNANSVPSDFDGDGLCDALDPEDNRGQAGAGAAPDVVQESPGFTPGFASVLAVVSLLGAAALGRREED